MSDDVRRVLVFDCDETIKDSQHGTHALMPWEEYERLRARVAELENRIIVTVGGIDVDLLDAIAKHKATIDALAKENKHILFIKDARIAELEREMEVGLNPCDRITEDRIDAAWERATGRDYSKTDQSIYGGVKALEAIGIVACEKCGGHGSWTYERDCQELEAVVKEEAHCPACYRNGKSHGWIWSER